MAHVKARAKFYGNRITWILFSRSTAFLTSRQNGWRHKVGKNVGIDLKFFMRTRMAQMKVRDKFDVNRSTGTLISRYTAFLTSLVKTRQNWRRHKVGKNVGIAPFFFLWPHIAQMKPHTKFEVNLRCITLFFRYPYFFLIQIVLVNLLGVMNRTFRGHVTGENTTIGVEIVHENFGKHFCVT